VRILNRYVLKEHLGPLLFAGSALTSLMLLNYIAKEFAKLAGKGLGWGVIGEFFVLAIPFTVAMTLPMAVLVATLYAFGRLAAENEITALRASGIGIRDLLVPVMIGGMVLSFVMVAFNDQVLPRANHRLRNLQEDIAQKKPTFALRPQVINTIQEGRLYLRAGRVESSSNRLHEVAIFDLGDPSKRRTIYADSGDLALANDGADLRMTLYHGYMQEVSRSTPGDLQRLFYVTNVIRVKGIGNQLKRNDNDYRGDREMSVCEMGAQVNTLARERAQVEREFTQQLVNQVRILSTGRSMRPDNTAASYHETPSIDRIYCGAVAWAASLMPGAKPPAAPPALPGQVLPGQVDPTRVAPPPPLPGSATDTMTRKFHTEVVAQDFGATLAATNNSVDVARIRLITADQGIDSLSVEIHKKFALSFACFVFVLFGAPIALRFPRGGVGLTLGVSLFVFALYYVGLIAGEALADRDLLPPWLAMWSTNLIFLTIGLALLTTVGNEGVSSRGGEMGERLGEWRDKVVGIFRRTPRAEARA
jgi:lipopolysaccharide export system permease protein